MQQNASLLAIVAVHTAENEPPRAPEGRVAADECAGLALSSLVVDETDAQGDVDGELVRNPHDDASLTSDGAFSAVWTATIASKDAFCSIFHNLQDLHPFAPFQSRKFRKFASKFC